MNRTIKLPNNELFRSVIGDRKLKVFQYPVDGRLGMLGLSKIVHREAGHMPKLNEAYVFFVAKGSVVKVLSVDKIGQNILELHGTQAEQMRAELMGITTGQHKQV